MSDPRFVFGYGSSGFGEHTVEDALAVLADLGYRAVNLTLDRRHLDPYADDLQSRLFQLSKSLDRLGLEVTVEAGGRYLLDPRRPHFPGLASAIGSERRVDLLRRAVRVAADLGAEVLSFSSGPASPAMPDELVWEQLVAGVAAVAEEAARRDVILGFEPVPGMYIDTLDEFDELSRRMGDPEILGLTLDLGHCRCLESGPVPECVRRTAHRLVHVQVDDTLRGVHEHLEFGHGDIDFPAALGALTEVGYERHVAVDLPRHGHAAPDVAKRSFRFLREAAQMSAYNCW
ncbi:sugar phosphate isomerase/epimerase family protein [Nonomuraea aridisoli]|uniref:Xylose isomerase n=1 Tax=Nonomuraea aridisoli TaxID=2070368 RepID=A0A2W2E409_9ACTN|nr:sugar phosphate isomerase/epimerase family protein [Nonomuraea aridisoli]PZG18722.1 xylose isomerase [Nonomuraea aridisoli]